MADDDGAAPLTKADLADLYGGLDELRQRFDDLDEAQTEREKQGARADVADAKEDLETTAARLGVSKKTLEASIAAAKRAERKDELKPLLVELLDELKADADDPDDGGDPDPDPAAAKNGKAKAAADPPIDTPPVKPHWSERNAGELVR